MPSTRSLPWNTGLELRFLDVKIKGESIPVVSNSAITSIIKNIFFAYLIFARGVSENNESNLREVQILCLDSVIVFLTHCHHNCHRRGLRIMQ